MRESCRNQESRITLKVEFNSLWIGWRFKWSLMKKKSLKEQDRYKNLNQFWKKSRIKPLNHNPVSVIIDWSV